MGEIKPKKMINRNIGIALGIICIVLVALIAYFTVTGISAQNSYNNLQNQNEQLQTWLDGNETLLNQTQAQNVNLQNQVASLNTTIDSLTSNLTDLQNIVNMQDSTVLYNESIMQFSVTTNYYFVIAQNLPDADIEANPVRTNYAGYVVVSVMNSTSNSTYVELKYSSNGFGYNSTVSIGSSGSATFPILPTTSLTIMVANADTSVSINVTNVTITYYY